MVWIFGEKNTTDFNKKKGNKIKEETNGKKKIPANKEKKATKLKKVDEDSDDDNEAKKKETKKKNGKGKNTDNKIDPINKKIKE